MNPSTGERAADFYVETYDLAVSDWPGEITFYALYGDFFRQALQDDSTDMVWVAREVGH